MKQNVKKKNSQKQDIKGKQLAKTVTKTQVITKQT